MKYVNNHVTCLILVLAWIVPQCAQAQAGKSGLSFLKLGVSGRSVAMGDATSASISGAAATHYNPAGVLNTSAATTQILLMYKEWIQDVRSQYLGASVQLNDESAFGFSMNTATVSNIEIRTRPGMAEGTFSSRDYSLGVSYARSFSGELTIGVTAKFLYEKLFIDESNGLAFDIGAQYKTPIDNVRFGLALANLGSTSNLRNERIKLPLLVRVGPAYAVELERMSSEFTVASDVLYIFPEKRAYLNVGGEIFFNKVIAARLGYQLGSNGRGFSAGVGLQQGMFNVDYGYVPLSANLGSGHTFSLGLSF